MPIQNGWAIDLDSRDPPIPNLPLETPAAPAVSTDRAVSEPFQTRVSRSRRLQISPPVLVAEAAPPPPVVPYLNAPVLLRRPHQPRQLRLPLFAPVFPTAAAPVLQFAATVPKPHKRRAGRRGLFLAAGDVIHAPTETATPEAPESAYRGRKHPRTKFSRKLQQAKGPLHVGAASAPTSDQRPVSEAFQTRVSRSRRLQTAAPVLHVTPAAPQQTTYLDGARSLKRRDTARQLQLLPLHLVFPAAPAEPISPAAFTAASFLKRRETDRRRLDAGALLEFPQTPPVPPQPEPSWRLVTAFRAPGLGRALQPPPPQLDHPETPVVIVLPPLGGDDRPDARKHPGWNKRRDTLKRSAELRLEDDIRAIYRRLQGLPTGQEKADSILAAVRIEAGSAAVEPIRAVARASANNDIRAAEIEIALRLLLVELEEAQEAEDAAVIAMLLAQVV